jgi:hypothetical protein
MKGERKLVNTLLGDSVLHKLVKLGTLGVPTIVALISDLRSHTSFLILTFAAAFIGMMALIYFNLERARKHTRGSR